MWNAKETITLKIPVISRVTSAVLIRKSFWQTAKRAKNEATSPWPRTAANQSKDCRLKKTKKNTVENSPILNTDIYVYTIVDTVTYVATNFFGQKSSYSCIADTISSDLYLAFNTFLLVSLSISLLICFTNSEVSLSFFVRAWDRQWSPVCYTNHTLSFIAARVNFIYHRVWY